MVTPTVRLLRPLRDGGMGSVWVAEHLGLKTEVVVKFIAPELANKAEAAARFEREAAAAAQVRSPHVVQVFDHGTNPEHGPYMVMELLEGHDLGTYLKANKRLPPREVAAMVGQVAKALSKAHAFGIVHRDIKPDNIFLCDAEGGEVFVKLLDFGIAKADDRVGTATTTGQVMGTPYYMSPEQLLAEKIDARTDIWSLGVVAYEAITGQRPFKGETIGALTLQIHSTLPSAHAVAPDVVPAAFDAWFQRACAKNVDERFPTVREAAQALYEACQAAPKEPKRLFSARPPMLSLDLSSASSPALPTDGDRPKTELNSSSGVAPPLKRERKSAVLVIGGVVLLAGALGIFALGRRTSADKPTETRAPATAAAPAITTDTTPVATTTATEATATTPATAAPPASAAPLASAAPASSASAGANKPLKVSGPRTTHRPPRPRDGFDDIK